MMMSDTSSASEHTCEGKISSNERYTNIYRLLITGTRLLRRVLLDAEHVEMCITTSIDIMSWVYNLDAKTISMISANLYMHATDNAKMVHALLMAMILASKTLRNIDPDKCPLSEYAESRLEYRLTQIRNHKKACSTYQCESNVL